MPESPRIFMPFGQGLDRETGLMVVRPGQFEDLRNFLLHQGKMIVRPGFESTVTLLDDESNAVSHIVQGFPLRSERIGVLVGYQETTQKVFVYRVDADATLAQRLGEWVNDNGWGTSPPKVHMAESYGRMFMAHDTRSVANRAPTIYYDPVFGAGALVNLTGDFQDAGENNIRFRGVVRHLKYLFGWGYGDEGEDRPEYVRSSVAGDPTTFAPNHFFIAGDRRDAVLVCRVAGGRLLAQKESEGHVIFGSGRDDFGIDLLDPLYGVLDSQLSTNFGGLVLTWGAEGPRVWDGAGPSAEIAIPLDLGGPDPTTLVAEGLASQAFAHYLPDLRIVAFVFGRRVYALTVRVEGDWKWSYWELGFDPLCAFTLFRATVAAVAPPGYPVYVPPEGLAETPAIIGTALLAVRRSSYDTDQPRVLLDQSGNGAHVYLGPAANKDALLGDGPLGVGKRGVVSTEIADRGLGIPNTAQGLNVGGAGEDVRVTVNFSAHLDNGVQTLVAHGAAGTTRSWRIGIGAAGVVTAAMSEDGTAESSYTSTATLLVGGGFASWDDVWLRTTFDLGADTIGVEYSDDGVSWTALEAAGSVSALASLFQPDAADAVEIGGRVVGTVEKLRGGGVYSILVEEDSGGGFVESWSWAGQTVAYTELAELGNQGVAATGDPTVETASIDFDGTDDEARSWQTTVGSVTDLSDQFDVAPGEILTVVLYGTMTPLEGGGAAARFIPFGKKDDELVASDGWSFENEGDVDGFAFVVSDGSDQDATAVVRPVDNAELATMVYEIDGPDGEIRMRKLALPAEVAVYADQGSGTNAFGVMLGRRGTGDFMALSLRGFAVWKSELTVGDQVSVGDWMSN